MATVEQPGFIENVYEAAKRRAANISNPQPSAIRDFSPTLGAALNIAGQAGGVVADIPAAYLKAQYDKLPEPVQGAVKHGAAIIQSNPIVDATRSTVKALPEPVRNDITNIADASVLIPGVKELRGLSAENKIVTPIATKTPTPWSGAAELENKIAQEIQREAMYEKAVRGVIADFKAGKITTAEYPTAYAKANPYANIIAPRWGLQRELRAGNERHSIANTPQENILQSERQLGKNIADGGLNNRGVFELGDKYVARLGSFGGDGASSLVNYKDKITSPRIAKTLQVKEIDGKVYQVQQKVTGTPVPQLTEQQLKNIPQEHIDNFWKDTAEIDRLGLSIDISGGKSNIFYDKNKGFQFIDLGVGRSTKNTPEVIMNTYQGLRPPSYVRPGITSENTYIKR